MRETERLTLRAFTESEADAALILALDNDPEVTRYVNGGRPATPRTVRERVLPRLARRYPCLGGRPGFWAAEHRTTRTFLGWFALRPVDADSADTLELGYRLTRPAWGHGYATEGARALVAAAFAEWGARRVTANTMAVNTASRRVMEKAGLRFVRRYADDWPETIPGSEHGEVEYALTSAAAAADAMPVAAPDRPTGDR